MKVEGTVHSVVCKHGTRNPFELCDSFDIAVFFVPLVDLRGLYTCEDGVDMIFISDNLSNSVASFVCGHEVAHYIFDKGTNRIFLDKHTYSIPDKYENRADKFAAHLLWGHPPLFDEQCLSDWEVADCLNVPVCSVNARLLELGIYY